MTAKAEFQKALKSLSHRHHLWQVWSDFCELSALSIANSVDMGPEHERREQRYLRIMERYEGDEPHQLGQMLGMVTVGLEGMDCDFLGESFMELDLGSQWGGQFFTPFELCQAMAKLQVMPSAEQTAFERGFITLHDPACGAGAMLIGVARALHDAGLNYQQTMHATCIDVDSTAAHMAYIQLSLLHIPAVVVVGNTLTREMRERFVTPAHLMGIWDRKPERGYALGSPADETPMPAPEPLDLNQLEQGDMFETGEDAA